MAKVYISKANLGGATLGGDGKVKAAVRKPRDASEGRRWAANKNKIKPLSRKAAAKFNRP